MSLKTQFYDILLSSREKVKPYYKQTELALLASRLRLFCIFALLLLPLNLVIDLSTSLQNSLYFPLWMAVCLEILNGLLLFALLGLLGSRSFSKKALLFFDLFIFTELSIFFSYFALLGGLNKGHHILPIILLFVARALLIPSSLKRTAWLLSSSILFFNGIFLFGTLVISELYVKNFQTSVLLSLLISNIMLMLSTLLSLFAATMFNNLQNRVNEADQIGRYKIKGLIGKGGMGEVYLAELGVLKRPCALKIVNPETSIDPQTRERFQREALQTSRLNHPNTITLFDFGQTESGLLYYAMEYLEGLDLGQILKLEKRLPSARVVHFMIQACLSLHDAHRKGIIHRDLKPENFFILNHSSEPDFLKVLDFGLAKAIRGVESKKQITVGHLTLGTPAYMSPEASQGKKVDERSDIYALGTVLFRLLTGEHAHLAANPMEMLLAHVRKDVEAPSIRFPKLNIPLDLEQVLLKSLKRDPNQRFQNIQLFREALSQCEVAGKWTIEQAINAWRKEKISLAHSHPDQRKQSTKILPQSMQQDLLNVQKSNATPETLALLQSSASVSFRPGMNIGVIREFVQSDPIPNLQKDFKDTRKSPFPPPTGLPQIFGEERPQRAINQETVLNVQRKSLSQQFDATQPKSTPSPFHFSEYRSGSDQPDHSLNGFQEPPTWIEQTEKGPKPQESHFRPDSNAQILTMQRLKLPSMQEQPNPKRNDLSNHELEPEHLVTTVRQRVQQPHSKEQATQLQPLYLHNQTITDEPLPDDLLHKIAEYRKEGRIPKQFKTQQFEPPDPKKKK